MKNTDLRAEAKKENVKLWQIAEWLGLRGGDLSRKLRHELPEQEKNKIRCIIEEIKAGEKNE
jgi:hypothetical protein